MRRMENLFYQINILKKGMDHDLYTANLQRRKIRMEEDPGLRTSSVLSLFVSCPQVTDLDPQSVKCWSNCKVYILLKT